VFREHFVAHFVGSLCRPSRSNAALFDKVFDEVSDKDAIVHFWDRP
jgi:hypothetical protein